MKKISFVLSFVLIILLSFPLDVLSKGGWRGGRSGYRSSGKSYKSGHSSRSKSYKSGHTKSYKGKSYHQRRHISSSHRSHKVSPKYSKSLKYHSGVKRDSHGRIERSQSEKKAFLKSRGLTKVPRGYEVDHVIPLYAGGRDHPSNMRLITKEQHRAKTKADYERYGR
jgi:5-methylcytosine-specific restriction endonuclease McrA